LAETANLITEPRRRRDMGTAAERFVAAWRRREQIAIFADYDVDGGASAALLICWLRQMGRRATLYVPDRIAEGYGPNETAMAMLPAVPFTDATLGEWTGAVGKATGRRGRGLFMPLRKALTGRAHGPDMSRVMPLLRVVKVRETGAGACRAR